MENRGGAGKQSEESGRESTCVEQASIWQYLLEEKKIVGKIGWDPTGNGNSHVQKPFVDGTWI